MPFDEDLTAFFKEREFADEGLFLPPSGPGRVTRGILDWSHIEVDGIDSRRPVWVCRSIDVPMALRGYKLRVQNKSFSIAQNMPDGTGLSYLVLQTNDS